MSLQNKVKNTQLEVHKSVLDWCNSQVDAGNTLTIGWEGGGDSGWAYFKINDKEVNNDYTEFLLDRMYEVLDYGSWAGEFNATGVAKYDKDEQAFVGTDEYSEDETIDHPYIIQIDVPNELWFDSISVQMDQDYDDSPNVEVTFNIKNGFLSPEHDKQVEKITNLLINKMEEVADNFADTDREFRGIWENTSFNRSEGEVGETHTRFTIESVGVRTTTSDEKSIYLEVEDEQI